MVRVQSTCPFCKIRTYDRFYSVVPSESNFARSLRFLNKTQIDVAETISTKFQISIKDAIKLLNISDTIRQQAIAFAKAEEKIQKLKAEKLEFEQRPYLLAESEHYRLEMAEIAQTRRSMLREVADIQERNEKALQKRLDDFRAKYEVDHQLIVQKRQQLEQEMLEFKIVKAKFEEEKKLANESQQKFCIELQEQLQKMIEDKKIAMYEEAEAEIARRKETFDRQVQMEMQRLKPLQDKYMEAETIRADADALRAEYDRKMQILNNDIEKKKKIFEKAKKMQVVIQQIKQTRAESLQFYRDMQEYRAKMSAELYDIRKKAEADEQFRREVEHARIFADRTDKYLDIEDIVEYMELVKGLVQDAITIKKAHESRKDAPYRLAVSLIEATSSHIRNKVKKRMKGK